jgi:hypothetical protein
MSDFKNIVCWQKDRLDAVFQTAALDAEEAVFKFTHSPMSFDRLDPNDLELQRGLGELDEERALQDYWLKKSDHMSCAVIGDPGTGKSHLIKWIYRRVEQELGSENHIILVPRDSSNLSSIIELIIQDFDGPNIEQIRTQVQGQNISVSAAKRKVMEALAHAIDPATNEERISFADEKEEYLRGSLPQVLRDQNFQDVLMSRNESNILDRLVKHLFGKRETVDDLENDCKWKYEDLQIPQRTIERSRDDVKELLSLIDDDEEIRKQALEVLNKFLKEALASTVGVRQGSLLEAFNEIRKFLWEEGKSLYLFVEDVSTARGLEGELLEIINVKRTEAQNTKLAPFHSVLGFTRDDFSNPNFVPANLRQRFSLILDFSQKASEIRKGFMAEFSSRYLNAVRYPKQQLESALGNIEDEASELPSFCKDCAHKEPCHKAFGEVEGRGLYPFTDTVIKRIYSFREGVNKAFNPRAMSNLVLKQLLEHAEPSILDEDYPSAEMLHANELGPKTDASRKVRLDIKAPLIATYGETNGERVAGLIALYGEPSLGTSSLKTELCDAFGIQKKEGDYEPPPEPPTGTGTDTSTFPPPPPPVSDHDEFDEWHNAGVVEQRNLGPWRKVLFENLKENFRGDFLGLENFSKKQFLDQKHIKFEGQTQQITRSAKAVKIGKVEKTLGNAIGMRTLSNDIGPQTNYQDLANSLHLIEGISEQIQTHYRKAAKTVPNNEALELSFGLLHLAHLLHVGDLPTKKDEQYEALMNFEAKVSRVSSDLESSALKKLKESLAPEVIKDLRTYVRDSGMAFKGTSSGRPVLVDPDSFWKSIKKSEQKAKQILDAEVDFSAWADPYYDPVKPLLESLPEKVKTALNAQDSRLKSWLTKVQIHFGDDDPSKQSLKQFSDDLLYLIQSDKIRPEMRDEFLTKAKDVLEAGELDSIFLSAKKALEYEGMEKLACIGRLKFGCMDDSLAFLDEAKNLVDYGVRMLNEGNEVDDAEKEVKGKIESCRQKLQTIEDGIVKLKKEQ